jgi:predicted HicB family RNase H-like nuclease
MPYRPRELVVRAREAAAVLLATLDRNEMVGRFLDLYAAEHRRPGRADQPAFYREQLQMIRREAILASVLRIEAALPARLRVSVTVRGANRRQKKKGKRSVRAKPARKKAGLELAIPFLDLFREEFFVALGQALDWTDDDAQEFWRDLELYEKLSAHDPGRRAGRAARAAASGPFVDRVALLLDPSLMEQARREAGKFQIELNASADRVLRKVFSRRRAN